MNLLQPQLPSLAINLWYLDDGHLIGSPQELQLALDILQSEGLMMGISLNAAKCMLWGPGAGRQNLDSDLAWDKIPRTPWSPDTGIKVLGIPVVYPHTHGFAKFLLTKALADLDAWSFRPWLTSKANIFYYGIVWTHANLSTFFVLTTPMRSLKKSKRQVT